VVILEREAGRFAVPSKVLSYLCAGRPLLAEVRTHGLGNGHYPGYYSHFEQTGWSVPHFVTIIGYDPTGVWLNDPGISWGRGYHITYAQLTHAIADLGEHLRPGVPRAG